MPSDVPSAAHAHAATAPVSVSARSISSPPSLYHSFSYAARPPDSILLFSMSIFAFFFSFAIIPDGARLSAPRPASAAFLPPPLLAAASDAAAGCYA